MYVSERSLKFVKSHRRLSETRPDASLTMSDADGIHLLTLSWCASAATMTSVFKAWRSLLFASQSFFCSLNLFDCLGQFSHLGSARGNQLLGSWSDEVFSEKCRPCRDLKMAIYSWSFARVSVRSLIMSFPHVSFSVATTLFHFEFLLRARVASGACRWFVPSPTASR